MGEGLGDEESSEFEFRAERKDRKGNHKTQQTEEQVKSLRTLNNNLTEQKLRVKRENSKLLQQKQLTE